MTGVPGETALERVAVTLGVNGRTYDVDVEARWTLADTLREKVGLKGTHVGCEQGACGACTVLLGGQPVRSCLVLAAQCAGGEVTTVEGIGARGDLHPFQRALHEHHGLQCGFCTPGFVTLVVGALEEALRAGTSLDEADLQDLVGANLCRCTGYRPILAAARQAAGELGVLDEDATGPATGGAEEGARTLP